MRSVHIQPRDGAFRRFTFITPVSAEAPTNRQLTPADSARERLFEGLDGQPISAGSQTWRVRIYSICEEPAVWWLQLQLDGSPEYAITMRMPRFQTAHDTLSRLSRWLADAVPADDSITIAEA
jgi:hypothetical protein